MPAASGMPSLRLLHPPAPSGHRCYQGMRTSGGSPPAITYNLTQLFHGCGVANMTVWITLPSHGLQPIELSVSLILVIHVCRLKVLFLYSVCVVVICQICTTHHVSNYAFVCAILFHGGPALITLLPKKCFPTCIFEPLWSIAVQTCPNLLLTVHQPLRFSSFSCR